MIARFARSIIDANIRLSRLMEATLHLPTDKSLWRYSIAKADTLLRALPMCGRARPCGGRRFIYRKSIQPDGRLRVIAVDVSADELALNGDVRETCVADVSAGLPLPRRFGRSNPVPRAP